MPLVIFHFSDSHGRVPAPPEAVEFDVVVCSGDMLPDRYLRKEERLRLSYAGCGTIPKSIPGSPPHQEHWLRTNLPKFQALARGKPFLFVPGNHDFYDPVPMLRGAGIDAHDLTERIVEVAGLRFYGLPYIPWCGGGWNYELGPNDMEAKVDEVVRLLEVGAFDVLVAHCPPWQMLDKGMDGRLYGNAMMLRALLDLAPKKLPRAYLCGHVHSSSGDGRFRGMYVSNAATKMRLIPIT